MKIIKIKPFNNSVRHQLKLSKNLLAKNTSFLNKIAAPKSSAYGKCRSSGQIVSWHKQGGVKKMHRPIGVDEDSGVFLNLFSAYDPNRTSFSSVVFNLISKKFSNLNSTSGLGPGSLIQIKKKLGTFKLGYRMRLRNMPTGSLINNVGDGFSNSTSYIKSAGSVGQLIETTAKVCKIRLPSGSLIEVPSKKYASLGSVSNKKNRLVRKGKAGRNRNLGRRPVVRGIAMNPVDHPHGGRSNGGRPSVTPWGLPTKSGFYLKRRSKK